LAQLSGAQQLGQNIEPAIYFKVPNRLSLPNAFAGNSPQSVYAQYNPAVPDEQIKVTDFRYDGGFEVNLTVSNFTKVAAGDAIAARDADPPNLPDRTCVSPNECISYRKIGIVTLAENGVDNGNTDKVDYPVTGKLNIPPGSDNNSVNSDLDCDWDKNFDTFENACETLFEYFTGAGLENSNPITVVSGDQLNPARKRIGEYWLALGIKVVVPGNMVYGSYTSTFTFDLIPMPFPDEKCANGIDDDQDGYIDESGCTP
jgi:hypothetical protein